MLLLLSLFVYQLGFEERGIALFKDLSLLPVSRIDRRILLIFLTAWSAVSFIHFILVIEISLLIYYYPSCLPPQRPANIRPILLSDNSQLWTE